MSEVVHRPFPSDDWWRTAVIYQIYPRSFADGNGDGIGDLAGITSRLDHLANLGVDAVWVSPFYRSPQKDAGYDVADYRDIDPLFGTLSDAEAFIARAHELGLRVIVDLVPNHTSSQHAWFQQALAAKPGSAERDRYIFRDGRGANGELPPNNWHSIFGGPAWTRAKGSDGQDEQWYLHLFDSSQPDLDWNNPEVRDEFHDILRFWLNRGVDGFRVDVSHGLVKKPGLPDWAGNVLKVPAKDGSGFTERVDLSGIGMINGEKTPMFDQDSVHEIYRGWRKVLDEFDPPGQRHSRAMVAEAWVEPMSRLARYVRDDEMQQAFNFAFLTTEWDADAYRKVITESLQGLDQVGAPATWVLSNHDVVRHPSRFGLSKPGSKPNGIAADDEQPNEELGLKRARAATTFMLALPGSAYIYQGEELGLPEHTSLDHALREDPTYFRTNGDEVGRDGCRVPIPWQAEAPGLGFSPTGATWLPQPDRWAKYAADAQEGVPSSTLELYRKALRLRRDHNLGGGGLTWLDGWNDDVIAFRNDAADGSGVTVLANLSSTPVELPAGAEIILTSTDLPGDGTLPADTAVWING